MTEEQWAVIEGFPDYAVSNLGRVKSLRFDRILTLRVNSYGHYRVVLYRNKEAHDVYVHRLVAAAFATGYLPWVQVKHHDSDKSNNYVNNLRMVGKGMGQLIKEPPRPIMRRVRIVETQQIFRRVEDIARFLGGDASSIYRVLRGERRHHKGYTFEFVEEGEGD